VRRLDRDEARQLAVRAQLLDATKPADLTQALEKDRTLFELRAYIRPMTAVALHVPEDTGYSANPKIHPGLRLTTASAATSSPVSATPDHFSPAMCPTPVKFHGARPAGRMIATSRRCWSCSPREARSRSREGWGGNGFGISPSVSSQVSCPFLPKRPGGSVKSDDSGRSASPAATGVVPGEPLSVGDAGVPVTVEGLDGDWRADPEALDQPFVGRTALLSPFDRLIHDRDRTMNLFDFEYVLEMYKPAEKRRWGYFALPVLHHDRLVGKLDARTDRKAGTLIINALHEDIPFTAPCVPTLRRKSKRLPPGSASESPRHERR